MAFDLETSGRYPLEGDICEMAAVKWHNGEIVDRFQTLVKPRHEMSKEVIGIHQITNEMVAGAPAVHEIIAEFHKFIQGSVLVAHHAPFDMGFLAWDFEKSKLALPELPVLCSALLSRKAVRGTENHRLATLIKHFSIQSEPLHRALADAEGCLRVMIKVLDSLGKEKTFEEIIRYQGKSLYWQDFSMMDLAASEVYGPLVEGCVQQKLISLVYDGGSRPGQARPLYAVGIVRSPDGDFFVGREENQRQTKRYFLDKIREVKIAP